MPSVGALGALTTSTLSCVAATVKEELLRVALAPPTSRTCTDSCVGVVMAAA
jgi:hypothetical protein